MQWSSLNKSAEKHVCYEQTIFEYVWEFLHKTLLY